MAQKKLKFVSEEKFEEYRNMSEDELIEALKSQHAFLEEQLKIKKESGVLKECRSEIAEYRKNWLKSNPEAEQDLEDHKAAIKAINEERDAKIEADLEEKKTMEADYNENINGAKEHVDCMVYALRFHQN